MATGRLKLTRLLRPYWMLLAISFVAMLMRGAADVLEPWPLKVIFDYVLGSKEAPAWLSGWGLGGHDRMALLNTAAVAVVAIAVIGAVGSYTEKYLSTTVGKRVGYDLRHCSTTTCSGCRSPSTNIRRRVTWLSGSPATSTPRRTSSRRRCSASCWIS